MTPDTPAPTMIVPAGAFLPPVPVDRGTALVLLGAEIATARHDFAARLARTPQPHRFGSAD